MKVVCIDNLCYEKELTYGKVYDVISTSERRFSPYKVLNDLGEVYSFDDRRFITLEEWREMQLKKIL